MVCLNEKKIFNQSSLPLFAEQLSIQLENKFMAGIHCNIILTLNICSCTYNSGLQREWECCILRHHSGRHQVSQDFNVCCTGLKIPCTWWWQTTQLSIKN